MRISSKLFCTLACLATSFSSFSSVSLRDESFVSISATEFREGSSGTNVYQIGLLSDTHHLLIHGDITVPITYQDFSTTYSEPLQSNEVLDSLSQTSISGELELPSGQTPRSELDLSEKYRVYDGDFNRDGKQDLLFFLNANDKIGNSELPSFIAFGHSGDDKNIQRMDFYWTLSGYNADGETIENISVGDFDGDGRTDIKIQPFGQGEQTLYADNAGEFEAESGNLVIDYGDRPKAVRPSGGTLTSGGTPIDFRVDESGAATYVLSPYVPSGIGGVAPEVSLSYSSSGGNGFVGNGWSINAISSIYPCSKTKETDGLNEIPDVDWRLEIWGTFCLDGARLIRVGSNEYRLENDPTTKIIGQSSGFIDNRIFTVLKKDGSRSVYEWTGQKVVDRVNNNGHTWYNYKASWSVRSIEDNVGNKIEYQYDASNSRIESISYAPNIKIEFEYENRLDTAVSYSLGEKRVSNKRLKKLKILEAETAVRTYDLRYDYAAHNGFSQLRYIQECGRLNSKTLCHEPIEFKWNEVTSSGEFRSELHTVESGDGWDSYNVQDFNGDGFPDVGFGTNNKKLRQVYIRDSSSSENISWLKGSIEYQVSDELTDIRTQSDRRQYVVPEGYRHNGILYTDFIDFCTRGMVFCTNYNGDFGDIVKFSDYNRDGLIDVFVYHERALLLFLNVSEVGSSDIRFKGYRLGDFSALKIDEEFIIEDVDGDGALEFIVKAKENRSVDKYVYLIDPHDSASDITVGNDVLEDSITDRKLLSVTYDSNLQTRTADINGDGKTDLLMRASYVDNSHSSKILWDIASGTTEPRTDDVPSGVDLEESLEIDVNGDGLVDLLTKAGKLHINNGAGFQNPVNIGTDWKFDSVQTIDFNMDGKQDMFLRDDSNKYWLYLSTGTSFSKYPAPSDIGNYDSNVSIVISDLTSNGVADFTLFDKRDDQFTVLQHRATSSSTIDGSVVSSPRIVEMSSAGVSSKITYKSLNAIEDPVYIQDVYSFSGTGSPVLDVISPAKVVYEVTSESPIYIKGRGLEGYELRIGYRYQGNKYQIGRGSLGFRLVSSLDYTTGIVSSTEYAQEFPYVGMPLKTVSAKYDDIAYAGAGFFEINDAIRGYKQHYSKSAYTGSTASTDTWSSPNNCQNLVLGSSTYVDPSDTSIDFWTPAWTRSTRLSEKTLPATDPVTNVDSSYTILSCSLNLLNAFDYIPSIYSGTKPNFYYPHVDSNISYNFDDAGRALKATRISNSYLNASNFDESFSGDLSEVLVETMEFSESDLNSDQIETGTASISFAFDYRTKTINEYDQNDLDEWHFGRLTRTEVSHERKASAQHVADCGDGQLICTQNRTSEFTYHSNGLLATSVIEPGTAFQTTTSYEYDGFGNKVQTTLSAVGQADRITKIIYQANGRYIAEEQYLNSSGDSESGSQEWVTSTKYESYNDLGMPTKVIVLPDRGLGASTETVFDAFGRSTKTWSSQAGDYISTTEYGLCSGSASCPDIAYSYKSVSSPVAPDQKEYFDVTGSSVRKSQVQFNGAWIHTDVAYDALGRAVVTTNPHTTPGYLEFDDNDGNESGWDFTTTEFDWLGRVSRVIHTDNSVSEYDYAVFNATGVYQQSGTQTQSVFTYKNALGETIKVIKGDNEGEENLNTNTTVSYYFDAQGNVPEVYVGGTRENHHHVVKINYNLIGQKTSTDDPDKGVWSYTYTRFGELETQTDANGVVTTNYYDDLGRVKRKTAHNTLDEILEDIQYEYSIDTNSFGQLSAVYDSISGYREEYTYDDTHGNIQTVEYHHADGQVFYTRQSYDRYGRSHSQWDASGLNSINTFTLLPSGAAGTRNIYNNYGYLESVVDVNNQSYEYIKFLDFNHFGNIKKYRYGNGYETTKTYGSYSGRLKRIVSDKNGVKVVEFDYSFDDFGNINSRDDGKHGTREEFGYTWLNQIETVSTTTNSGQFLGLSSSNCGDQCELYQAYNHSFQYKSDNPWQLSHSNRFAMPGATGGYSYSPNTNRVSGVDFFSGQTDLDESYRYTYDNNGNQLTHLKGEWVEGHGDRRYISILQRSLKYTHFDKPSRIVRGSYKTEFDYSVHHGRTVRRDYKDSQITKTTRYIGSVEHVTEANGTEYFKRMVAGVAIEITGGNSAGTSFLHKDHLGSVVAVTNDNGVLTETFSYDVFGKRRAVLTPVTPNVVAGHYSFMDLMQSAPPVINKGFTGHEMLDEVGLIHMNGRVYDPELALFLSADPYIQSPGNILSTNRYSYVLNNPLSYTDPSGYFFKKLWRAVKRAHTYHFDRINQAGAWIDDNKKMLASVAIMAAVPGGAAWYYSFLAGAASGYLQTGTLKGALISGAFAAVGAGVSGEIASMAGNTTNAYLANVAASAVLGGVRAVMEGGKFGHGFRTAAISSSLAPANGVANGKNLATRMAVSAVVGGTSSRLTGGKFENGAITSAFSVAVKSASTSYRESAKLREAASNKPQTCSNNPINIATGEKYLAMVDYNPQGSNNRLKFERYYSSYAKGRTSLGRSWSSNFDKKLSFESDSQSDKPYRVHYHQINGKLATFIRIAANEWQADSQSAIRIKSHSNGWVVYTEQNSREYYNAEGKLLKVEESDQYGYELKYNNSGMLIEVVDVFGYSLEFEYSENNKLSYVITPSQEIVSYEYDDIGRLARVINPDDSYKSYQYHDFEYPYHITSITNELNDVVHSMAYDHQGRATLSALGNDSERVDMAYGHRTSVLTNALGLRTTYYFDESNKPIRIEGDATESCVASNKAYQYDAWGNVVSKTDWNGIETVYAYNERGLEVERVEALGTPDERKISTQWHTDLNLPLAVEQGSSKIEYVYNARGLLIEKILRDQSNSEVSGLQAWFTDDSSRKVSYAYNEAGQVIEVDGPRDDVDDITRYFYDDSGHKIRSINAVGHTAEFREFDDEGRPTVVVEPNGLVTELVYNSRGWLSSSSKVTPESRLTTHYEYAHGGNYVGEGQISRIVAPNGGSISYVYDSSYNVISMTDELGGTISYERDLQGNIVAETFESADGHLTSRIEKVYDELSRVIAHLDQFGEATHYSYNVAGELSAIETPDGARQQKTYDALGRVVSVLDPMKGVVGKTYDASNRVTSVTDQRGLTTQYSYNAFGDQAVLDSPDTGITQREFNKAGLPARKLDSRGVETRYQYDAAGRVLSITYPEAEEENIYYEYDDKGAYSTGKVANVTDINGRKEYQYNYFGQVTDSSYQIGNHQYQLSYSYDSFGKLSSFAYPSGNVLNLERDELGRIASVYLNSTANDADKAIADFVSYSPFGGVDKVEFSNNTTQTIAKDVAGRIEYSTAYHQLTDASLYTANYAYDVVGNISSINRHASDSGLSEYEYDLLGRLTVSVQDSLETRYAYDAVGNRMERSLGNGNKPIKPETYLYADYSNQLEFVQNGQETRLFAYDPMGNTISDVSASSRKSMVYNHRNRLIQVQDEHTGELSSYEYNDKGQRVKKSVTKADGSVQTIHFHYNEDNFLIAETDAGGNSQREYFYADATLVAMMDYSTRPEGALYYVYLDHLGSVAMLTDTNGQIAWQKSTLPFGQTTATSNTIDQKLQFPGQYADTETGYFYNYFRDYDPSIGRYIQSDPIGLLGGVNTFSYVLGNPINYIDFNGLASLLIGMEGEAAYIAGANGQYGAYITTGGDTGSIDGGSFLTGGGGAGFRADLGVSFTLLRGGRENIDGTAISSTLDIGFVSISSHINPESREWVGASIGVNTPLPGVSGMVTKTTSTSIRELLETDPPAAPPRDGELYFGASFMLCP